MFKIDYNEVCKIYDDVRYSDIEVINSFFEEVTVNAETKILDIGCGTGNYANTIQNLTKSRVYGLEPSQGMIEKAKAKNSSIEFVMSDAENLPFDNNYFDFIYMTDVIHHVPDIDRMFYEIYRVLDAEGKVCIDTQSHRQIDLRFVTYYFPSTAEVDKKRYPSIDKIITSGEKNNLKLVKEKLIYEANDITLNEDYLELIEKKGFSMFHLICDRDYETGLKKLREDFKSGDILKKTAGSTQLWFEKG